LMDFQLNLVPFGSARDGVRLKSSPSLPPAVGCRAPRTDNFSENLLRNGRHCCHLHWLSNWHCLRRREKEEQSDSQRPCCVTQTETDSSSTGSHHGSTNTRPQQGQQHHKKCPQPTPEDEQHCHHTHLHPTLPPAPAPMRRGKHDWHPRHVGRHCHCHCRM